MSLVAAFYRKLRPRRGWLVLLLLVLTGMSGWYLSQLKLEESIVAMLPDGNSRVADDFRLLQRAPFARKLVIQLNAEEGTPMDILLEATDRLREQLPPELFHNLLSGPDDLAGSSAVLQLDQYLPLLADRDDLQQIETRLTAEQIDTRLERVLAQLLQPQGVALKKQLRRDPLSLGELAMNKLRYLNPVSGMTLTDGHFVSQNGRSTLILADTPIQITDAVGAEKLLNTFELAAEQLPKGIRADLVSGHPYTLANAKTIQRDMQKVLVISGLGILLVFLLFLRSLRAIFVYLLPLFSMLCAVVITGLCFDSLSGITIGFGAVLLGITIDFGLHVYFALYYGGAEGDKEAVLAAVSRPVLFGALTTLAAFGVLLGSDLPGQRQLAVFAGTGIIAALVLALLFLPQFVGFNKKTTTLTRATLQRHIFDRNPGLRKVILLLWLLSSGLFAWQAQGLSINGELRQLSYLPEALQQAEQQLAANWGNMRGRALVFASGSDLETALQRNEQVWQQLERQGLAKETVSLAPIFPARQTQLLHQQQWQQFWQQHRAETSELLQSSGQRLGFAPAAFAPFLASLTGTPQLINEQLVRSWGLGPLLDNLLLPDTEQGYQVLTLIPDRPELISGLDSVFAGFDGITLVSQTRFGRQLSNEIGADFSRFISSAGVAVLLLLLLLFRRVPEVLLALLPVLTGLLAMFAGMTWLGLELNLFNVVGSILIIGLGVDYGIFMVCHGQQRHDLASSRAILVSGLTTLVGFGALVLARHPALHSIGLTVLLGISAAVPTAVLVIPAFRPKRL